MMAQPSFAIIGLGEVGTAFAHGLLDRGVKLTVASRPSPRALESAKALGVALEHDIARAVAGADVVLLTITGAGLHDVVAHIAPVFADDAVLADLTAAAPAQVVSAVDRMGDNRARYVDVAIMGAVSLYGIKTPLLASGESALRFAAIMNALGFEVSAREGSVVGDASRLKLLRSLFAKGLDAVVAESMLAAEALGLRHDLMQLLGDFDQRPLRDHIEMYLRTHLQHAARRLVEMELAEQQLLEMGLPSLTTSATIARYRRTMELAVAHGAAPARDADAAIGWLLSAEQSSTRRATS